jgi:hypothetical protein
MLCFAVGCPGLLALPATTEHATGGCLEFNNLQDLRAFVYDLMTKEQQDNPKKNLPPAELNKIRNGMNIADRHGLLGDVHQ